MLSARRCAWMLASLAALTCAAGAQDQRHYITDPLGRIESVTTAEGTTTYAYYPSGQIREVRRPDGSQDSFREDAKGGPGLANPIPSATARARQGRMVLSSANRFGFTGMLWEPEIGLYYAKARYYDPVIGRFTTQDSFLGRHEDVPSLHRYVYGRANPLRFVDPTGHESVEQWLFGHTEDGFGKAFGKAVAYNTWNVLSLGTLARQDRLVKASESGRITEEQYQARTGWNAATAGAQLGLTIATAGAGAGAATAGAGRAAVSGVVGGVAVQGAGDVGAIYGTQTKSIEDVSGTDYALAAGFGAAGGLAARQHALKPAASLPFHQRKSVTIVESEGSIPPSADPAEYHVLTPQLRGGAAGEVPGVAPGGAGTASVWSKGPGPRGLAIEDAAEASGLRAGRLPKGFRGVDFHEGVVTSTKSVDLRLPSYQDPVRLQKTLQGYVDKLETFQGGALKGRVIRPSDIAGRQLDVAIPPGPLSASQRLAIETAQAYGSARGIRVNVFVVE